jgi:DNA (cytosine-5)-methyltransferase 1
MKGFKVVSLFSGAGGLDLGFKQTGMYKIVFANDILIHASTTYSKNLGLKLVTVSSNNKHVQAEPMTVTACDVACVDFSPLKDLDIDVVVGGPPCQDFSIVRGPSWDRRGIEVKRGRLYVHFVRALAVIQPKAFVFENVPGLVSANKGLAYKTILKDFTELNIRWNDVKKFIESSNNTNRIQGYEIIFSDIIDFSNLGVPQKRERLIIVGIRKDLVNSNLQLIWSVKGLIEETLYGKPWLFRKYPLTTMEAFEGKPLPELGEKYREVMRKWEGVWNEVKTSKALRWKENVWSRLSLDVVEDYMFINNIQHASEEELEQAFKEHEKLLKELGYYNTPVYKLNLPDSTTEPPREDPAIVERMKRIPPGENHEFVRGTKWHVEGRGISLVYRRIHPLKPSYTIVAYGGGGTHGYHYDRDRATLTLREKARLQTFLDTFLFYGRKTEIRAQIGEAVPPLATKRIGEALAKALEIIMQS